MSLREEVHRIMAEPLRRFVASEQEAQLALKGDENVDVEVSPESMDQFMFDSMVAIAQALTAIADRIDQLET